MIQRGEGLRLALEAGEAFRVRRKEIRQDLDRNVDGRWLAYTSNESGVRQIYVTSFPTPTGKWPVSTDMGEGPRWSADGKRLYFLSRGRLVRADVRDAGAGGPAFSVTALTTLFPIRSVPGRGVPYDIAPDGRVLVNVWDAPEGVEDITVLQNWAALRR